MPAGCNKKGFLQNLFLHMIIYTDGLSALVAIFTNIYWEKNLQI
jgi:hypothetical protein